MRCRPAMIHFAYLWAVLCVAAAPRAGADEVLRDGFTPLFNGKDLSGWKGVIEKGKPQIGLSQSERTAAQNLADESMREHWKVIDGTIVFDGMGESLSTTQEYGDFELYVDWKLPPGGDSGIYLRGCPQVQIWDPDHQPYWVHGAENGSGGLWNNKQHRRFPIIKADRPIGQWNTFRIQMVGAYVTVELNGHVVVDHVLMENHWDRESPIFRRGPIILQDHGNNLWFRNLSIREIPADEANKLLKETPGREYSVFNGQDFSGWLGDTTQCEIIDDSIVCNGASQGTVYTADEYSDFVAQYEFKMSPGGQSDLVIGHPLDVAKKADKSKRELFYRIRLSDTNHGDVIPIKSGGRLDGYRFEPSAAGYLRQEGSWNVQKVYVTGSRVRAELNGFTILDVDVSSFEPTNETETSWTTDSASRHFGITAQRGSVAYRNLSVRPLPGPPLLPPSRGDALTPTDAPIVLFNGRNLEGFYPWLQGSGYVDPKKVFTVKDGVLTVSGDGFGGLITHGSYRDYHLVIEYKWGEKTWRERKQKARDAGVLVHGWGPDGGFRDIWMASIEAQIIEGGVGDLLVLSAIDPITTELLQTRVTADIILDRDGEKVWKKGGDPITITEKRINWWGRDWNWTDTLGFRWREDADSPHGQWTRMDVIADGNKLQYRVNGAVVNEAYDVSPSAGKILLQSELAEWHIRRLELWPLGQTPGPQVPQDQVPQDVVE